MNHYMDIRMNNKGIPEQNACLCLKYNACTTFWPGGLVNCKLQWSLYMILFCTWQWLQGWNILHCNSNLCYVFCSEFPWSSNETLPDYSMDVCFTKKYMCAMSHSDLNSRSTTLAVCTLSLGALHAVQWMPAAYLTGHIIHQHCPMSSSIEVACYRTKLKI